MPPDAAWPGLTWLALRRACGCIQEPSRIIRLARGAGRPPAEVQALLESYKHYSKYATQALKAANLPKNLKSLKGDMPMNQRQMAQTMQNMSRALPPQLLQQLGGMGGLQVGDCVCVWGGGVCVCVGGGEHAQRRVACRAHHAAWAGLMRAHVHTHMRGPCVAYISVGGVGGRGRRRGEVYTKQRKATQCIHCAALCATRAHGLVCCPLPGVHRRA